MLHKDKEVAKIESADHYLESAMAGIGALKLASKRSDGYIETIYRREYRMSAARRLFLVLLVIATCIVCDQATKLIAKRYLQPGAIFSFAGDMFRLQYAENTGAFLSLGSSLPESWRHITFTVCSRRDIPRGVASLHDFQRHAPPEPVFLFIAPMRWRP